MLEKLNILNKNFELFLCPICEKGALSFKKDFVKCKNCTHEFSTQKEFLNCFGSMIGNQEKRMLLKK